MEIRLLKQNYWTTEHRRYPWRICKDLGPASRVPILQVWNGARECSLNQTPRPAWQDGSRDHMLISAILKQLALFPWRANQFRGAYMEILDCMQWLMSNSFYANCSYVLGDVTISHALTKFEQGLSPMSAYWHCITKYAMTHLWAGTPDFRGKLDKPSILY